MKNFLSFKNDYFYGIFFIGLTVIVFFLPVVLGFQSLTEAIPGAYDGYSVPSPQIKTPWTSDGATHARLTVPVVLEAMREIKQGIPPLWMAYSGGGGEVMAGSNSSGLYYPLRLFFFLLWNNIRAFDWYFLLRFLIAGFGAFLFFKEINLGRRTALWGGIAYMFTGYFMVYLTYTFLDIDALLPYVFWSLERYFRSSLKSSREILLTSIFVSLTILGEQPQTTIIAGILWGGYFLWRVFSEKERRASWAKYLFALIKILVVSCLIALPFLIDIFINYSQGFTVNDLNSRGTLTFPPIYLLHFLVPPSMFLETAIGGHLYDQGYSTIPYIGTSVLIIFLLSIWVRKKPRFLYFFYAFVIFVVAKNAGFPLVNWVGTLPILKLIGWHKAYGPMAFSIVVLAAYTIETLVRRNRDEIRKEINWRGFFWTVSAIPIAFLTAYLIAPQVFLKSYIPHIDFFARRPETIQAVTNLIGKFPRWLKAAALAFIQNNGEYVPFIIFSEALLFIVVTVYLIYLFARKSKKQAIATVLIVVTAFEMWLYMPKIRDGFRYFNPYEQTPPYIEFLQKKMVSEGISRTFATGYTFSSYLGELYRIQRMQTFSAIIPKRYYFFLPESMAKEAFQKVLPEQFLSVPHRVWDAANIKYVLSQAELPKTSGLKLIYDADLRIYENTTFLPKAYVVYSKETVSTPEEAHDKFYEPQFDWRRSVIVENGTEEITLPAESNQGFRDDSSAKIITYQPNQIIISTDTKQDGLLVLAETFYPGWHAYIDGRETKIYPANVLFRAIALPTGKHQVQFVFKPIWFWPSLIISLITLIIALILICRPYAPLFKRNRSWSQ